jgi:hypothetical protein
MPCMGLSLPTGSQPTIQADEDAPSMSGHYEVRQDSQGYTTLHPVIERARQSKPGSDDEKELEKTLGQLKDVHDGVIALGNLAQGFTSSVKGTKMIGAILAAAIAAHPVIGALMPGKALESKLDAIHEELEAAQIERREMSAWLWALERCRKDPSVKCPEAPPSIRILVAKDEQAKNGH